VRELEGALTRWMAYASLTGTAISLPTAQQVLPWTARRMKRP
jgi:chromosomal replication initiation ATPase DnaA